MKNRLLPALLFVIAALVVVGIYGTDEHDGEAARDAEPDRIDAADSAVDSAADLAGVDPAARADSRSSVEAPSAGAPDVDAARLVRVEILDERGSARPGAAVSAIVDGELVAEGVTDEAGLWWMPDRPESLICFFARAEGAVGNEVLEPERSASPVAATATAEVADSPAVDADDRVRDVVVELEAAWRLRGRVVDRATGIGVPGAEVLAIVEGFRPPTLSRARIVGRSSTTRSDALGEFVVEGLAEGRAYRVFAAGGGLLTPASGVEVEPVAPSDEPVEIPVAPVHGALLTMLDASTGLPLPPAFRHNARITVQEAPGSARALGRWENHVLGLDDAGRWLGGRHGILPLLFDAPGLAFPPPSVVVNVEAHGFLPAHARIQLGLLDGGLPNRELPVAPLGAPRREVVVRFEGLPEARRIRQLAPVGEVDVRSADGQVTSTLVDPDEAGRSWLLLPDGAYELRFRGRRDGLVLPSPEAWRSFEVSGGPVEVVLDRPAPTRIVELDLRGSAGVPLSGSLPLVVGALPPPDSTPDTGFTVDTVPFSSAPYVLTDLAPGTYRLWRNVVSPRSSIGDLVVDDAPRQRVRFVLED